MENPSYEVEGNPSGTTPRESTSAEDPIPLEECRLYSENCQRLYQRMPLVHDEPTLIDSEGNPLPEEALASDRRLDLLFSIGDDEPESLNEEDELGFEDDSREIEEHLANLTDRPVELPAKKARSVPKSSLARQDQVILSVCNSDET